MSSAKETHAPEFTGMRARLWPIHSYEIKKFLPLGFIMFCLLFNYTLLRDTKDTLVVNAAGAGAISFLKLYCVTPAAILFVVLYAKLSNILNKENLFYAIVTPFLVFFGAFAYLIYPNLHALHPSAESIEALHQAYPYLSGFIDIYAYWTYSAFYVLSEIWGSAMIALLFWQFANQVTRMHEAKRFYGLFVVIGNVALIFSGQYVKFFSDDIKNFCAEGTDVWQVSLNWLMGGVILIGLTAMALYRWMHTNVLTDPLYYDAEKPTHKKKKEKPGLVESMKIILKSPELGLIALLIMAYGVTINLVEIQFKEQLKWFYAGDKGGYNGFMGNYSTWTGVMTIIFSLFFGSSILRRLNWFGAAVITPVVILLCGAIFFAFIFAKDHMAGILASMALNPIAAATFLGAFIVITSKVIKYCLFDPTKEMAYIPLDEELKSKGKAAVDVIGGRAGKAGGSLVVSVLLMLFATKDVVTIAPISFIVFGVVCGLWLVAVKALSKRVEGALVKRGVEEKQAA
jgi:AAA family ATP:ADP antiporter